MTKIPSLLSDSGHRHFYRNKANTKPRRNVTFLQCIVVIISDNKFSLLAAERA